MSVFADSVKSIKTSVGTFKKTLVTSKHIYYINEKEEDDDGYVMMFNKEDKLILDNFYATNYFFEDLQTSKHEFISKSAKENLIITVDETHQKISDSDVELNFDNKQRMFSIYFNDLNIFFAIHKKTIYRFCIIGDMEQIMKDHREKILAYRLGGNITKEDVVTPLDIFMQGDYISKF